MHHALSSIAVLLALLLAVPTAKAESVSAPERIAEREAKPGEGRAARAEVIRDLSRLPDKVRERREQILEAAKSGDPNKLVAVMQTNETMPVFSFGGGKDPVEYWKASYPDSEGLEALAILISVLEMPFLHLDRGTAQEMYVWPYFYGLPLESLTPEQKVELFRLVTGADWKEMEQFGAYIFYRVGISPDGVWHFFVAGD